MENSSLESLKELNDSVVEFGQKVATTILPLFQELGGVMQVAYDVFWQAYREAGTPYGESDEGLLRWYREVAKVNRLRLEAERILQHHEMLADFRKSMARSQ